MNFENALTDGPKYRERKIRKTDANSIIAILHATYGRKGHTGNYHYDIACKAVTEYGKPVAYNTAEKRSTGKYATEYLDNMCACYRIEGDTITVYATKEWI